MLTLPPFATFQAQLAALADDPAGARAVAEAILATYAGAIPIIEGTTAHFLYPEVPGRIVGVGGEWNAMDARQGLMTPIGGGLLHYAHTFEPDARLDYLFSEIDAAWADRIHDPAVRFQLAPHSVPDPFNPRIGPSGLGTRSELAMPGYHRPPLTEAQPGTPTGTVQPGPLSDRTTAVYLPPGYAPDAAGAGYPSVYFQDGGEYLTLANAPVILDNLIAVGLIPPVVGIFVPPVRREVEYNCDDEYVRFFSEELVPAMAAAYALHPDRTRRAVIGPSLGGLIALYLGSQRPDLFGLIGAQSSGVHRMYGPATYDARRAYTRPTGLPSRLALTIGTYESCFALNWQGQCRDLLTPVRDLQAGLHRAGVAHAYSEHPQSHSWGLWRDTLVGVLSYLFAEVGRET